MQKKNVIFLHAGLPASVDKFTIKPYTFPYNPMLPV